MALGNYTPLTCFSFALSVICLGVWIDNFVILSSDSAVRSICTTTWCWGFAVWASLSGKVCGGFWLSVCGWLSVLVHVVVLLPRFPRAWLNSEKQPRCTNLICLSIDKQQPNYMKQCHGFTFEWYMNTVMFLVLCCFVTALLWLIFSFFCSFHRPCC